MDNVALAAQIAALVSRDTNFWVAVVAALGVIAGSLIAVVGILLQHWLSQSATRALDSKRTQVLLAMLQDSRFPQGWRSIETLSKVVGATEEETARLLIMLGARGSEGDKRLWALISRQPLETSQR
jgi:uncharacterized membrane protein